MASMIEGVLKHCISMEVEKNYVASHGQSEVAFTCFHLLGFQLMPRLIAINSQKLYRPDSGMSDAFPNLQPILTRPINWEFCGNYNKHGIKACTSHLIAEKRLYHDILSDLNNLSEKLHTDNYYNKLLKKIMINKESIERLIQTNLDLLAEKKKDKTNLVIALSNGIISNEDYQLAVNMVNDTISKLETENIKLSKEIEHKDVAKEIRELKKHLKNFSVSQEITSELLHKLIDKIEITSDGTATVHYRFNDLVEPAV